MKFSLPLLLALTAQAASAAQGCPAVLELPAPQLGERERKVAQGYANCLIRPDLTSSQARIANVAACRANMPVRRSPALEQTMRQVEQAAISLGACSTRLTIKAKTKT
jgi:hypothetical protein